MRRETGKEQRVRVPYNEEVANHVGLESCGVRREVCSEALTEAGVGRVIAPLRCRAADSRI